VLILFRKVFPLGKFNSPTTIGVTKGKNQYSIFSYFKILKVLFLMILPGLRTTADARAFAT